MKNTLRILSTFLLAIVTVSAMANMHYSFRNYGARDGMRQKEVMQIMQDTRGFMWLATWDGLYRFDGSVFKCIKATPGDGVNMTSNRLDHISEDVHGNIWMMSYDGHVYRHNTRTNAVDCLPVSNYHAQSIIPTRNGGVWITTEGGMLLHVDTGNDGQQMRCSQLFATKGAARVNSVYEDSYHRIWILASNGIYSYSKDKKVVKRHIVAPDCKTFMEYDGRLFFSSRNRIYTASDGCRFYSMLVPGANNVLSMSMLRNNKYVVVGTENNGLFVMSLDGTIIRHYSMTANPGLFDSNKIERVYVDQMGDMWIAQPSVYVVHIFADMNRTERIFVPDKDGNKMSPVGERLMICESRHGQLFLSPAGAGLAIYDRQSQCLVPFFDASIQSGWSTENNIVDMYFDRQDNLWICSKYGGLQKVTAYDNKYKTYTLGSRPHENDVRGMMQDRHGNIWVGNKMGSIVVYNSAWQYLGGLSKDGRIISGCTDIIGKAYCMTESADGTIWIGTKLNGLIKATPAGAPLTYNLQYFSHSITDPYSISHNDVFSLYADNHGMLWIATYGGGLNLLDTNNETWRFINTNNELKHYPKTNVDRCRFINADRKGRVWIATTTGLLLCQNPTSSPADMTFRHFQRDPNNSESLSYNDIHSVFFTSSDEMYVSTYGGGINKLVSYDGKDDIRFKPIGMKDGLESDVAISIQEDRDGMLWIASETGLTKFDPKHVSMETFNSDVMGMQVDIAEGRPLRLNNGDLIFPTLNSGVLCFSPRAIKSSEYVPHIVFTDLVQNQQSVRPSADGVLKADIDLCDVITLPHDNKNFTIDFMALDMTSPSNVNYAYRLEDFDKDWNYTGSLHTATYTNLPHGTYRLLVRSTNGDGLWVDNIREIKIVVKPSFWETPWAWILYLVGFLLLTLLVSYVMHTIYRLNYKVKMEQDMSDIKLRFFTNISHELRMPLTLIAGPVSQLVKSNHLDETERELLSLTDKNVARMLNLVNQLLDFRKIQNNRMQLSVQQTDLKTLVSNTMDNFRGMATDHDHDFSLQVPEQEIRVWCDVDKIEKVVFNLLSNAFKYTPSGKAIRVKMEDEATNAIIIIEDEGIGISLEKQAVIFNRFVTDSKNVKPSSSTGHVDSTGIGLALVKELVELHNGHIELKSQPGMGSCFKVVIPKGRDHFDDSVEFILNDAEPSSPVVSDVTSDVLADTPSSGRQLMLIVEDNSEMRYFLRHIFSETMTVVEAQHGAEAMEYMKENVPDIIISDVMMPVMDGIELLHNIRMNTATSHVPVVMLTAKTDIDSRIRGLEVGADDYITKPFSSDYLKARVENIIESRHRLMKHYTEMLLAVDGAEENVIPVSAESQVADISPAMPSADKQFMDELLEFLNDNIDNGTLRIEDMALHMNMSRSVFYGKFRGLTGMSPVEFLRNYRMKKAAELILSSTLSINQVSYAVGFNDQRYFSTVFKQYFGVTPTVYKDKKVKVP